MAAREATVVQCASTLGVKWRETNGRKWTAILFGYMRELARLAALSAYHTAVILSA
jgi:Fe2+ transport system protein B